MTAPCKDCGTRTFTKKTCLKRVQKQLACAMKALNEIDSIPAIYDPVYLRTVAATAKADIKRMREGGG
jgi:hypothetical protein